MDSESEYIENTFDELQDKISSLEGDVLQLATEYMSQLETFDGSILTNEKNYALLSNSDSFFDEAYESLIAGFLIMLYNKIVSGSNIVTKNMASNGIKLIGDERSVLDSMLGVTNGKIAKNGYLWKIGRMSQVRDKFYNYMMSAISGGVKLNNALRGVKPIFKSGKTESDFAKFYRLYAYDSVMQTMNAMALYVANKNGLNKFLYQGGIIKDSRDFCIERAGKIFTRADGEAFNNMDWRGKIEGVSFFIAAGGYNCKHFIKWLPKE